MGMCKNYTLTPDYVLNEMSYANLIMYSSVLPSYDKDEKDTKFDKSKDANVAGNFTEEVVKRR